LGLRRCQQRLLWNTKEREFSSLLVKILFRKSITDETGMNRRGNQCSDIGVDCAKVNQDITKRDSCGK